MRTMSASAIDWSQLRKELQPDGALRDIYVHDTNEQHWERFLTALPKSKYQWRLRHGERSFADPLKQFHEASKLRESDPVQLHIELSSKLILACHFFTPQEIELDVLPNDLQSDDAIGLLIEFMEWLEGTVKLAVVLTHENRPEDVILRIENAGTSHAAEVP